MINKETYLLASIIFCKDKSKECPVCGESLETLSHLECRRALRRTKGGRKPKQSFKPDNPRYWDQDKWH